MTLADDTRGFEHRFIETNGVKLHVVVGGGGPLVLLLHGWPECWATWRHVMQPLKNAGFTVAVPDLRGFNLSDKPKEVGDYTMDKVVEDLVGLIHALGFQKTHVIAHDWGGAAAWHLAQKRDDVLDKLVILNSPHPGLFVKRLSRSLEQIAASYYMFLFQLPRVPERKLASGDFSVIENIFRHQPKRAGAYDDEDIRVMKEALGQPGALTATLNYYRASFRQAFKGNKKARDGATSLKRIIERPVLVLWGLDDVALPPANLDGIERTGKDLRVVRLADCSHWVPHDKPEVVVEESVRFFRAS